MDASFCKKCKDQTCLKTKKPCEAVEALLRDDGIWDAKWIRPRMMSKKYGTHGSMYREIPFSSMGLENFAHEDDLPLTGV